MKRMMTKEAIRKMVDDAVSGSIKELHIYKCTFSTPATQAATPDDQIIVTIATEDLLDISNQYNIYEWTDIMQHYNDKQISVVGYVHNDGTPYLVYDFIAMMGTLSRLGLFNTNDGTVTVSTMKNLATVDWTNGNGSIEEVYTNL